LESLAGLKSESVADLWDFAKQKKAAVICATAAFFMPVYLRLLVSSASINHVLN
jgi:hypothetical protein